MLLFLFTQPPISPDIAHQNSTTFTLSRRLPIDLWCRALSSLSGIVPNPPDVAVIPGRLIRDRARPPRREAEGGGRHARVPQRWAIRSHQRRGRWCEMARANDNDDDVGSTSLSSRQDQRRAAIDWLCLLLESASGSVVPSSSPDSSANDATMVGGGGSADGVRAIALRRGVAGGDADYDPDAPTMTGAAASENPDGEDRRRGRRGRPQREGRGVPVPVYSVGGDRPPSATDAQRLWLKQRREQQQREGGKEEGSDH